MALQKPVVRHNMKVAFVTGGSGFVGQYLIEDLIKSGVKVVALARSSGTEELLKAAGATTVRGDLFNKQALVKGMEGCDIVFHCASTLGVWKEEFEKLRLDNVVGAENVMEAAKKSKSVKRFIYVSSTTTIFDGSDMLYADETTPYPKKPISAYSHTKAIAERDIIAANSDELQTISVRLPVVWGPRDPLLPTYVRMAALCYWIWPAGGNRTATPLYVSNATSGLIAAAIHGQAGEIYHLSDDTKPTFREIFSSRLRSCGCPPWQIGDSIWSRNVAGWILWMLVIFCEFAWRVLPLPGTPPLPREGIAIATSHFSVSDKKARSMEHLGWRPVVNHEEGTKREGNWYKNTFCKTIKKT